MSHGCPAYGEPTYLNLFTTSIKQVRATRKTQLRPCSVGGHVMLGPSKNLFYKSKAFPILPM